MPEGLKHTREAQPEIVIADATQGDGLAIHELRKKVWLTTYPQLYEHISNEDIERNFKDIKIFGENTEKIIAGDPNMHFFVAKNDDQLVGFCLASIKEGSEERWVDALYVLDGHQGLGIGKNLATSALSWLEADEHPVHIEVADNNNKAKEIYESWGFKVFRHIEPDEEMVLKMPQFEMIREPASIE